MRARPPGTAAFCDHSSEVELSGLAGPQPRDQSPGARVELFPAPEVRESAILSSSRRRSLSFHTSRAAAVVMDEPSS